MDIFNKKYKKYSCILDHYGKVTDLAKQAKTRKFKPKSLTLGDFMPSKQTMPAFSYKKQTFAPFLAALNSQALRTKQASKLSSRKAGKGEISFKNRVNSESRTKQAAKRAEFLRTKQSAIRDSQSTHKARQQSG